LIVSPGFFYSYLFWLISVLADSVVADSVVADSVVADSVVADLQSDTTEYKDFQSAFCCGGFSVVAVFPPQQKK